MGQHTVDDLGARHLRSNHCHETDNQSLSVMWQAEEVPEGQLLLFLEDNLLAEDSKVGPHGRFVVQECIRRLRADALERFVSLLVIIVIKYFVPTSASGFLEGKQKHTPPR